MPNDFLTASRDSRRDLMIEGKLDKIAIDSVPKKKVDITVVLKPKTNQKIVKSSKYSAQLDKRDMALDAKVEEMAQAAIPNSMGRPQAKITSPITQQMIAEAQAESQIKVPVEINGVKYRYKPSSLPEPDLIPPPPLKPVLSYDEVNEAIAEKELLVQQITAINEAIRQIDNDDRILDEQYNVYKPEYDRISSEIHSFSKKVLMSKFKISNTGQSKDEIIKMALSTHPGNPEDYATNKEKIAQHRVQAQQAISNREAQIAGIDVAIQDTIENKKENDAVLASVEKENKERLMAYATDLEALNKGNLSIEQQPNETNEDYRARLLATASDTISDAEIQQSVNLSNTLKAKHYLEQVLDNKAKVETIVKLLSDDERYLFLKEFPRIKKVIIDTYGVNNKDATEQDFVDVIKEVLNSPIVPKSTAIVMAQPQGPTVVLPPSVDYSRLSVKKALERIAQDFMVDIKRSDNIKEIVQKIELSGRTEIPIEVIRKMEKSENKTFNELRAGNYLQNYGGGGGAAAAPLTPTSPSTSLVGIGIPHYPKLHPFGKVMISPDKLYFKNTLIIRNSNGKPLTGLTNLRVSDVMVSILMKCLEGHKISKSELNLLSNHERQVYDNLMYMSGGHKVHEHSIDKSAQEMKHRLSLIEGELEAGNNSELLKKELHALLHRMAHTGLITLPNAAKYYRDMKEIYFGK